MVKLQRHLGSPPCLARLDGDNMPHQLGAFGNFSSVGSLHRRLHPDNDIVPGLSCLGIQLVFQFAVDRAHGYCGSLCRRATLRHRRALFSSWGPGGWGLLRCGIGGLSARLSGWGWLLRQNGKARYRDQSRCERCAKFHEKSSVSSHASTLHVREEAEVPRLIASRVPHEAICRAAHSKPLR
jgi:hypothetical protein